LPEIARNISDRFDLAGKVVLEIGCGWGGFLGYLQSKNPKMIFGIEPTHDDLKTALEDDRLSNTELIVASGLDTPFESKKFDFIFMWEVLEHIPTDSEEVFFSEISRIIKDDGILCLSTPYSDFRSIVTDPAYHLLKHRHYSLDEIRSYAIKADFEVQDANPRGTWVLAIWHIAGYFSKWVLRRKTNILNHPIFTKFLEYECTKPGWVSIFVTLCKKKT